MAELSSWRTSLHGSAARLRQSSSEVRASVIATFLVQLQSAQVRHVRSHS